MRDMEQLQAGGTSVDETCWAAWASCAEWPVSMMF